MSIVLETDFCVVKKLEKRLYLIHYKSVELQIEDYLVLIKKASELAKEEGSKIGIIYTQAQHFSINKDTWAYMKENVNSYSFMMFNALVVSDLPQRLMTKLFMFFSKNDTPTRIFSKKDKAIEWAKEIL